MLSPPSKLSIPQHGRPRGLWKGRVNPPRYCVDTVREWQEGIYGDSDTDDDAQEQSSLSSGSSNKRRRLTPPVSNTESDSDEHDIQFCRHHTRGSSPLSDRVNNWVRRTKIMDTSTTAHRGVQNESEQTCDYDDWLDLKDLFAKASEQYENADASDAIPVLRGVIHECHRFLIYYQDPSVLFTNPPIYPSSGPSTLTPTEERLTRDWVTESPQRRLSVQPPSQDSRKCKHLEPPTAFHAILGAALFLFGNLIAQDQSLAMSDEPSSPCPYWLAALDVFETGENLPSYTDGRGTDVPVDWRMAIIWGRTLVCVADDALSRSLEAKDDPAGENASGASCLAYADQFGTEEPNWPPDSPFSAIAARRPPVTRRMSLSSSTPNDLMVLAMDQFSRGIFHMPHPRTNYGSSSTTMAPVTESFSRAKELFTIASEVLSVADKFDVPSERQYWASWADSVFNQMKMEADMDAWRGPINRARGRCWLIVGSAKVEAIEAALEEGNMEILNSEDAQEAREGLTNAVSFFERAKSSASSSDDPDSQDLHPLLIESLLTLANLTADEKKREELYARAQKEGGDSFVLTGDDQMDES